MRWITPGFWLGVWLLERLCLVLVLGLWCAVLPIAIVVLLVGEALQGVTVALISLLRRQWAARSQS